MAETERTPIDGVVGLSYEDRAKNAEELLGKLIVYAKDNPDGPGLVIPRFLLAQAEELVPDWRFRHTRPEERQAQAELLRRELAGLKQPPAPAP